MKRKIILLLVVTMMLFSSGVYAGTVIKQYKTPRGNIATVESEQIHKNRLGITVNGKKINSNTWYHEQEKTFVKLRDIAEMLGAEVIYNDKTMSADIKLDDINTLKARIKELEKQLEENDTTTPPPVSGESDIVQIAGLKYKGIVNIPKNETYNSSEMKNLTHYELDLGEGYPVDIYVSDTYRKEFGQTFVLNEMKTYFEFLIDLKNFKPHLVEPLDVYLVTKNDYGIKPMPPQVTRNSDWNDIAVETELFIEGYSMDKDHRITMVHELTHYFDLMKYRGKLNGFDDYDWFIEGSAEYVSKVVKKYSANTYNNLNRIWNDRFKTIEKQDFIDEARYQSAGRDLSKVQNIDSYLELPSATHGNYSVYNGNYYYLTQTYGEKSLEKLIVSLLNNKDRNESFKNAFGKSERQVLHEMLAYYNYFE